MPNVVDMAGFERSVLGVFDDGFDATPVLSCSPVFAAAASLPSTGMKLDIGFHFGR